MKPRLTKLLPALLALLRISATRAPAYYDPGVQRWINRDPVADPGFLLRSPNEPPPPGTWPTLKPYAFIDNTSVNRFDAFGLRDEPQGDHGEELQPIFDGLRIARRRAAEYKSLVKKGRWRVDTDKWFHCVVSCEMTRACGDDAARTIANVHEWWSGGQGTDNMLDQLANQRGRDCAGCMEKRSCEQCCQDKGYSR